MMESVNADKIIEYDSGATLSDGSAGGIEPDSITFDICKTGIDRWVSVSEAEIRNALYIIYTNHNQKIIEGAAGVAVASFIKMVRKFIMEIEIKGIFDNLVIKFEYFFVINISNVYLS